MEMKKNSRNPRILMVDDDADLQMIVHGWLSPRYDHISLANGEDLIEELKIFEPDLLILDVRMPGADGFTLCGLVRENRRFDDLPILFLTGCKEDEDFIHNLDAGATAFMTKPVSRRALLAMVAELVGRVPMV